MPALKGIVFAIACLVLVPAAAYAQASIAGVVKDTSGAVLPGVTVEAASPALIEKVRSVVTDGTGQYKVVDLRPGTYSVTFTLPGFNTFKREGIELAGSFTATVNADLRVGAVAETVTVTGDAPIVDIQSVTQQKVLGKDVLDSIPAGRNHANFANLIPGMTGALDYGGTNNLNLSTLTVHGGRTGDQRVMVDGMSISATSGNGELSNFIPDMTATQEVAVSYSAGSADQAFGGVQMNLIPREGGNVFKGSFFATAVNAWFQNSNYTPELQAAGLRTPNSIKEVYDFNPGAGGPIVKDKLWFYSAARWQGTQTYVAGLYLNKNAGDPTKWNYEPDLSNPAFMPLIQQSGNTRLTWQVTPRNKISGFYEHQYRVWEQLRPTIAYESATKYDFPRNEFLTGSYSSPITSRLLFDARVSDIIQGWKDRYPSGGSSLAFTEPLPDAFKSLIAVTEQGGLIPGLLYRGAGQTGLGPFIRVQGWIASAQASLSYVTGAHALKVGFLDTFGHAPRRLHEHRLQHQIPLQQRRPEPDHRGGDALRFHEQPGLGTRRVCAGQVDTPAAHAQSGRALRLFEYQFPGTATRGPAGSFPTGTSRFRRPITWAGTIFPQGSGPSTTCSATGRRPSRSIWAATSWPSV